MTPASLMTPSSVWTTRLWFLWRRRPLLARAGAISLVLGFTIAFLTPKRYTSSAAIMPPDQSGSGALMLAALSGHSNGLGALGSLASGFLGMRSNTAVFESLLHSGTVSGALIDRFDLRHVYHVRYNRDAARRLAHNTTVADDKKSGMITIAVEDGDPVRARDLAQAYLDELSKLVNRTSTSQARQERIFIEKRLTEVNTDLEHAQIALSDFSTKNSTIDIKEQTRAMVDTGARAEGELVAEQSSLQALKQIYGDGNVRVRQTEARIASLRGNLQRMAGIAPHADSSGADSQSDITAFSPPLRQLPRLGVAYADLYRRVRVEETVFELLTGQYEMARIAEAHDIPSVSVVDAPGIPEKKSFPPRLWLGLGLALFSMAAVIAVLFAQDRWHRLDNRDPRKALALEVARALLRRKGGVA
ncbi:GumC family protein [Granulicella sibirica]|uniref:Tyrosine-protein kinase Wzc n=1 Tax=Granulicella sibirica TaxID=2479048 RepID=A0A4Q0SU28_9BACT|nr:Wzz/FepE/Etk N-terminal domain-containing protein [Granulicella sibirica]RXH54197.1 Tyrosine-protein kinase Wzc [Granulicella sibirica]